MISKGTWCTRVGVYWDVARPVVSGSVYPGYSKHDFEGDVVEGSTGCSEESRTALNLREGEEEGEEDSEESKESGNLRGLKARRDAVLGSQQSLIS
eukprot:3477704-Rhodomonas_salina.1